MLPLPLLLARILPLLTLHKNNLLRHVSQRLSPLLRPMSTPQENNDWKIALDANDRAALFDGQGNLVWRSPALIGCESSRSAAQAVSGHNWHEFIAVDDLNRLVAWLLDPTTEGEGISFTAMDHNTGTGTLCLWHKARLAADHWLVLSAIVDTVDLPCVEDFSIDESNTSGGG